MIENNNPDINVDEIMAKIRAEIAGRTEKGPIISLSEKRGVQWPASTFDWQQFQSILRAVENNADIVNPDLPMARYPKSVRWFAKKMGRIVLYLSRIVTARQTDFNHLVLQAMSGLGQAVHEHDQKIADVNQFLHKHEKEIANQITEVNKIWHAHENQVSAVNQLEMNLHHLKTEFVLLQRQVCNLLEEARKRLPDQFDAQQLRTFAKAQTHQLDAFYVNFADRFRGSREDIKERFQVYLPIIRDNNLGTPETPVLDLGCGRGEWLEILKNENLSAQGVDLNQLLIESCREYELEVFESDIFDYLRSVPDQSLGAVTAFHLIEHLSFGDLIKLLDEALRVLKPGGVTIFETPNPENVLVGSCNFYYDPTHQNPIPPQLSKFMVESRGFSRVDIMLLHPNDQKYRLSDDASEVVQRLNDFFYGPQDYAVFGFKL